MAIKNRTKSVVKATLLLITCAVFTPAVQTFAQGDSIDVDRAFAQATQLHESGDLEGAVRGYRAILVSYPRRVDVRSNLGAAYSRLGRYEEAIEQYKQALAIDNSNQ